MTHDDDGQAVLGLAALQEQVPELSERLVQQLAPQLEGAARVAAEYSARQLVDEWLEDQVEDVEGIL